MNGARQPPSLTVAVATCGRPDSLATCLTSISAQSVLPDQVVVVDQDPRSETRDVIADCPLPIDYLEQERRGLSASRNLALANTTSEIVAVTDDDCHADKYWCESLLHTFTQPSAPQAVTGPILPPAEEQPPGLFVFSLRKSRETVLYDRRTLPWIVGSGANFAGRTDVLRQLGGWNDKLGVGTKGKAAEDCEIIDRLLVANYGIVYCGEAVIRHAWQTRERRKETRWTYSYGMGALIGTVLARGDPYGVRMFGAYGKQHLQGCIRSIRKGDVIGLGERIVALSALPSGILYGLRYGSDGVSQDVRSRPTRS